VHFPRQICARPVPTAAGVFIPKTFPRKG
jgi:hypothetical protein